MSLAWYFYYLCTNLLQHYSRYRSCKTPLPFSVELPRSYQTQIVRCYAIMGFKKRFVAPAFISWLCTIGVFHPPHLSTSLTCACRLRYRHTRPIQQDPLGDTRRWSSHHHHHHFLSHFHQRARHRNLRYNISLAHPSCSWTHRTQLVGSGGLPGPHGLLWGTALNNTTIVS